MADTIFCSQCGTSLDLQARFCPKCGAALAPAPSPFKPAAMAAAAPGYASVPPQPITVSAAAPPAMPPQYGAMPTAYTPPSGYVPAAHAILPYAGFWIRVAAYLLDILILLVPSVLLAFLPVLGIITNIVGIWLYFALQESSEQQATIGKRAMKIYVTDMQGHRISFGQATGRHFSRILSAILCIGYIMVAFTDKKQGLHDMIASTLVQRR